MRTTILALLFLSACGAEAIGIGPSPDMATTAATALPPPGNALACRPTEITCEVCGTMRGACIDGRLSWGPCELPDGGCP